MRNPILALLCLFSLLAAAQGTSAGRNSYLAAERAYRDGQFGKAIGLLETGAEEYDPVLLPGVYRLSALCCLATDDAEKADEYVRLLLRYSPYYTLVPDDPVRFADLVKKHREGRRTLVTASQQLETLEESPVPVTLITEEMIKMTDADNLKEVLATYVPGITTVEGNSELNLAMHGVYSSEQQKILIMQDGHRLNSRATNVQAPDYSISLDKVKQIEVLRGPASSLYGNAALTAVVNIITKEGRDAEGIRLSYGMGDSGTYQADLLAGKSGNGTDFLGWASLYTSEGEKIHYPPQATGVWRIYPIDGYGYINGFNRQPAYDLGCILKWDNRWKLFLNCQHAKMQPVYTYVAIKAPYTYEKYRRINGQKPGHSRLSLRGDLQYSNRWKEFALDANLYADADRQMNYEADGDSLPPGFSVQFPPDEIMDSVVAENGFFQMNSWHDYTYGASVKGNYGYGKENGIHGSVLAGLQIENYRMTTTDACVGDRFDRITVSLSEHNRQIRLGNEWSLSTFLQGKHYLSSRFILNGGFRYDYKRRFNGKTLHALSPRLACICKLGRWSVKASYARAFVDAPYFNRASMVKTYQGSENLKPEYLNAVQLSATLSRPSLHIEYDCNIYYNELDGLIYYDKSAQSGDTDRQVYSNAGSLNLFGVESSLSYTPKGAAVRLNLTYQRVLESENYIVTGSRVDGIPAVTMNLVASKSVFQNERHSLWGHATLTCYSEQTMPVSAYLDGKLYENDHYRIRGSCILNLSLRYRFRKMETSLTCNNVFGTYYTRAGLYDIDVPQPGRELMWKIDYTF